MRREHVAQPAIVLTVQRIGVLVTQLGAHSSGAGQIGDEDRRRRAAALNLGGRLLRRRRALQQLRIVGEDRLLQALEIGSGTQPELGVERPHRLAVGVQRLPLTPGAVQRQHQLPVQPLAQRLTRHQHLQLGHELDPATQRKVGLHTVLDRRRAQLLKARDLGRRERLERHIGQRRATPLLKRRPQPRRRTRGTPGRQRPPPLLRPRSKRARSSSSGPTRSGSQQRP